MSLKLPFKEFDLPQKYSQLTRKERRLVRQQYGRLQRGLCMWCHAPLSDSPPDYITEKPIDWNLFPPNFLQHPIHFISLQHCHVTDKTEGAVHAYCNAVMWQYHGR